MNIQTKPKARTDVPQTVVAVEGMRVIVHGKTKAVFFCAHKNRELGAWVIIADHAGDPQLLRVPARAIEALPA